MSRTLCLCMLISLASAAAAAPTVEDFYRRPEFSAPKISPDGVHAAAIVRGPKRDTLAVIHLESKKMQPVTNFADADVIEFHWVNNKRLVFNTADIHKEWAAAELYGWHAVDIDGTHLEEVGPSRPDDKRFIGYVPRSYLRFLAPDPAGGSEILIEVRTPNMVQGTRLPDEVTVWRWDTLTARRVEDLGRTELRGARSWTVDMRGVVRMARAYSEGREKIFYRDDAGAAWRVLEDAEEGELRFYPIGFDYDDKTLYVSAYGEDDKLAIYKYDFERNRLGERMARHPDVDMFTLMFNRAKRRLVGFKYSAERPGMVWADEQLARAQQMVDRALPGAANELDPAEDNPNRILVKSSSDVAPPVYYYFDAEKRAMTRFPSSRPWIKPAEMSERRFVRYKARDGMEIPAYLTLPRGSSGKNLPVVVDIHGGPWTYKQTWGFDRDAQFLASRGYAVLQPDFRGTFGYGKRHYKSSFGQWGFAMQDDITDGVQWLTAQGIADKSRVCLYGTSYGGYSSLWGLMKTPELYRCGVAGFALTDIGFYFDYNRWDWYRSVWASYGAQKMIGDPSRDADKFRSVSPVAQAERLKVPVLLAFGGFDQRVPIKNGNALRAALDQHGKKYEWLVYPNEGHGFGDDANRFDFYRKVETFLSRNLAPLP
jgi:dipeptidyl aminopeptidase/acylaminoacyl peptidase